MSKKVIVRKPFEVKQIVPRYIRVDPVHDTDTKKISYCLCFLDEKKERAEAIGGWSDRFTRDIDGNVLVIGLPPYQMDHWNGYMWDTESDAVMAREAIRLFVAMKEGGLIENI